MRSFGQALEGLQGSLHPQLLLQCIKVGALPCELASGHSARRSH
jgi:hypothetical protein